MHRAPVLRAASPIRSSRLLLAVACAGALAACAEDRTTAPAIPPANAASTSAAAAPVVVTNYDSRNLAEYGQKWGNIYGPLELAAGGTLAVSQGSGVTASALPYHVGADFSVYDHLKYIAVSNRAFAAPARGWVMFSVEIEATTPGTQPGRVVHGCYGAPGSWDGLAPCAQPWSAAALEGQQAGVVLNMINFKTGQLFDWFVSEHQVFALIERLPSNVTAPGLLPGGVGYVGLDKAYTQIIRVANVAPGRRHTVAIRFSRDAAGASVDYYLDGAPFAHADNVGIPLDVQRVPFTGTYPSLGRGEAVTGDVDAFVIGHGLFSLLDAFPFQHPERPDLSVSIPMSERLFGQGATGNFRRFVVTQVSY